MVLNRVLLLISVNILVDEYGLFGKSCSDFKLIDEKEEEKKTNCLIKILGS